MLVSLLIKTNFTNLLNSDSKKTPGHDLLRGKSWTDGKGIAEIFRLRTKQDDKQWLARKVRSLMWNVNQNKGNERGRKETISPW